MTRSDGVARAGATMKAAESSRSVVTRGTLNTAGPRHCVIMLQPSLPVRQGRQGDQLRTSGSSTSGAGRRRGAGIAGDRPAPRAPPGTGQVLLPAPRTRHTLGAEVREIGGSHGVTRAPGPEAAIESDGPGSVKRSSARRWGHEPARSERGG